MILKAGVAKGSGWQQVGAYVNLVVFYGVGVPVGASLGFAAHLRAKGLWVGIVIATVLQSLSLSLITALTNWSKQVHFSLQMGMHSIFP